MTRRVSTIFMVALLLTTNIRCTTEEFCQNKDLCDLISNTILPIAGIALGVDLTIVSAVYNAATGNIECGTEDAPASKSNFDVEFRASPSSPWEIILDVSNQSLSVDPLVAGPTQDKTEITLQFNEPGEYRFKTEADYPLEVEERNEDNNGSCAGCRPSASQSNNISYSEILTVYPNPDIPYDPSKPQVVIKSIVKAN
jgi:hypothetical protein